MMVSAFAGAYAAMGEQRDLDAALGAVERVEATLVRGEVLLHSAKEGRGGAPAFLDDTAAWAQARLDLFDATFDPAHLEAALRIARAMLDRFEDREHGGFFYTPEDHEPLIARTRPVHDGAVPSGASLATRLCLRLARWTEDATLHRSAERALRVHHAAMAENPPGFTGLLLALDLHLSPGREIVIVAPGGAAGASELLGPLRRRYTPNDLLIAYDPSSPPPQLPALARDRPLVDERATAYVCRNFTCSAPVTTWAELDALLTDA